MGTSWTGSGVLWGACTGGHGTGALMGSGGLLAACTGGPGTFGYSGQIVVEVEALTFSVIMLKTLSCL